MRPNDTLCMLFSEKASWVSPHFGISDKWVREDGASDLFEWMYGHGAVKTKVLC